VDLDGKIDLALIGLGKKYLPVTKRSSLLMANN
jgi:hypothetical protein